MTNNNRNELREIGLIHGAVIGLVFAFFLVGVVIPRLFMS